MSISVLIIGAGSIGNHLSYACRSKGWRVSIFDTDSSALERTKNSIYPERYGAWDEDIELLAEMPADGGYDLVVVGTPPATHSALGVKILNSLDSRILLIEKPLCAPNQEEIVYLKQALKKSRTRVLVGYNHLLTPNTVKVKNLILAGTIGKPISMHVRWVEHWGGIFKAHPWLSGPSDSYLGKWQEGGGSTSEHSHGISLWLYLANLLKVGPVERVHASMDSYVDEGVNYDRTSILSLVSESGFTGSVIQDVVSSPPEKMARIQGSEGFIEWYASDENGEDKVVWGSGTTAIEVVRLPRSRPDDFIHEVNHVESLFNNPETESPIAIDHGLLAMRIICAAHESNKGRVAVRV